MKTFRVRILALLLALVVAIQLATIAALVLLTQREAQSRAQQELQKGGRVAARLMQSRAEQLRNAVQVLVADFGFKEAVTSGEQDTIRSALDNSAVRIDADLAAFFDDNGQALASNVPELTRMEGLLDSPQGEQGSVSSSDVLYRTIDRKPYLLVLAPVRAPAPVGWAAIGFRIDAQLAEEMRTLLHVDVTYHDGQRTDAAAFVSTLPPQLQAELRSKLSLLPGVGEGARRLTLGGEQGAEDYVLLVEAVDGLDGRLHVILQTSLKEILAAFGDLRSAILIIAALGLLLALPIASWLSRSASRPLDELVTAAQRIESGNYSVPVVMEGASEFASVASTLNSMQQRVGERERRIREQSTHDDLTGLPNRVLFRKRLTTALAHAQSTSTSLALLLVDLREFEQINASFGHSFGDEVLRETARRLVSRVRADATIARSGTSRFLVLLPGEDETRAVLLAGLLLESVRSGLIQEGVPISLDAHVGICTYPAHGDDADTLLHRLDASLYDARQANAALMVYQPGRDEDHRRQLAILGDLRRAVSSSGWDHGELEVHYQPKVDIATQKVRSLEALVRWTHPKHGRISPAEFVPLAERAGSIILLTSWVLKTVHRQMRAWVEEGFELDVSVNLSAGDLTDPELPELIRNQLKDHNVTPNRLVLEITESAVMRETARAIRVMEELRRLGVRFSIDDFGTGYSSLAQLKRLPVDEIKIDKSFVLELKPDSDDAVIVRSTIELSHTLGMKVVAEGVETAECLRLLQEMNCDMAQGYFISRPLPGREVARWVRELNAKLAAAETATQQVRVLREHSEGLV